MLDCGRAFLIVQETALKHGVDPTEILGLKGRAHTLFISQVRGEAIRAVRKALRWNTIQLSQLFNCHTSTISYAFHGNISPFGPQKFPSTQELYDAVTLVEAICGKKTFLVFSDYPGVSRLREKAVSAVRERFPHWHYRGLAYLFLRSERSIEEIIKRINHRKRKKANTYPTKVWTISGGVKRGVTGRESNAGNHRSAAIA